MAPVAIPKGNASMKEEIAEDRPHNDKGSAILSTYHRSIKTQCHLVFSFLPLFSQIPFS
jgi:hypothetical protein